MAISGLRQLVGLRVAPDLLDQGRGSGPQHPCRSAQGSFQLGVAGFVSPPTVVGPRQLLSRGEPPVGDNGDQKDGLILAVPVPVRDLILDDPGRPPVPYLPGRHLSAVHSLASTAKTRPGWAGPCVTPESPWELPAVAHQPARPSSRSRRNRDHCLRDPVVMSRPFSPRPAIAPRKSLTAPGVTVPLYRLHWKYTGNDTSDRR